MAPIFGPRHPGALPGVSGTTNMRQMPPRNLMNTLNSLRTHRPLVTSFDNLRRKITGPAATRGILSRHELRQIVAEIVG